MAAKKILYIDASVRENSRTRELADYALTFLEGDVLRLVLEKESITPLSRELLISRDELVDKKEYSAERFRYARAFAEADVILIAAPFWDLSFPAALKVFIEQVMLSGLTFDYTPEGEPIPCCRAEKIIYITTAGGPVYSNEYGFGYIRHLADTFWQIPQCLYFSAECLDLVGADVPAIMERTKQQIKAALSTGQS